MLFVLEEFNDDIDIDRLIKSSTQQKITANTVIIDEESPGDRLDDPFLNPNHP